MLVVQILVVPGPLPGLNEFLSKACASRFAYAKLKKATEERIALYIRQQQLEPVRGPHTFEFDCLEEGKPGRTRDADNVGAGARKCCLDALQKAGIIPNDDHHTVRRITEKVYYGQAKSEVRLRIVPFVEEN